MNKDAIRGAFKSKTMWFNFALTVLGAAATYSPAILAFVPAAAPILALVGPANMILRMVTSQSLSEKADSPA